MGIRYYNFFSIMRMAISQKKLEFSAPGNKIVREVLSIMRTKGLISGFSLEFDKKNKFQSSWTGYPKYKVFLKYNYYGYPIIKKMCCYKMTFQNYLTVKEKFPKLDNNSLFLISGTPGIQILDKISNKIWKSKNYKLLAKIKI